MASHARSLLLRQADAGTRWYLILHSAIECVIDHFVQVDKTLHTALCLRFLQLLVLLSDRALEHAFVLLCMLLQLLVKRADLFLRLLRLSRL